MFGELSYTFLFTVFAIVPLGFVLSRPNYRRIIFQYKKVMSILFIAWFSTTMVIDQYTRQTGFWFNPEETNSGIYIFAIPLEDVISSALIGVLLPAVTLILASNERK